MHKYHEALAIIQNEKVSADIASIKVKLAENCMLAEDLFAPISLPSFDNTAMDGFAVRSQETINATKDCPIWFDLLDSIGAGEKTSHSHFREKSALEIMTGAPMPADFDAVIPVEKICRPSDASTFKIGVDAPLRQGENIRYRGEDIQKGARLLSKGERLTPHRLMTLTGLGIANVKVFKKIHIQVVSTGKELVQDKPIDESHQIYDCNAPFLLSVLKRQWDSDVKSTHLSADSDEAFQKWLEGIMNQADSPSIIISTGAVSAGKYDFIPRTLKAMGAHILFHKVAIRPGKPILFARLPNGSFYFGLPGNPSAVAAGYRFFVVPFLKRLHQMADEAPCYAKLDSTITLAKPLCFFQKAYHYIDKEGGSRIRILPGQASFMISPMLSANAWAMIEDAPIEILKDTLIPVYPHFVA
jgi:molybdopterin molybdotransferase